MRRFPYSELEMCGALEEVLLKGEGLPLIGRFTGVFREVSCRQGQPDFLLVHQKTTSKDESSGFEGPARAEILSLFPPKRPISKSTLRARTRYSPTTLNRTLRRLQEDGLITKIESGSFRSLRQALPARVELWALEVKLDNPRRAVFQAQQAKLYADRAIIVVPPNQAKNYRKWHDSMQRWGIGLLEFDPHTGCIHTVRRSRKSQPLSRSHQLYTVQKIELRSDPLPYFDSSGGRVLDLRIATSTAEGKMQGG